MKNLTDMHCHILPGLDDGSQNMEETVGALGAAVRQGVTTLIATPHFYPGKYEPTPHQIFDALNQVRRVCAREELPLQIYPGQECMYHEGLTEKLRKGRVLTLANSRFVLVEFDPGCRWQYLLNGLRDVKGAGFTPILAHFERYECLYEDDRVEELKKRGFLLQINYDRLREKDSLFHKNEWRQYVRDGVVDFLGSDCHGTHYRPYHIGEACGWMKKDVEQEQMERIVHRNFQKLIAGYQKA